MPASSDGGRRYGEYVLPIAIVVGIGLLLATSIRSPRFTFIPNLTGAAADRPPPTLTATVAQDGDRVFYDDVGAEGNRILLRRVSATNAVPTVVVGDAAHPCLSRNGKLLFFVRPVTAGTEIWRHDLGTGTDALVIQTDGKAEIDDVDEDGARLIVSVGRYKGGLALIQTSHLVSVDERKIKTTDLRDGGCFVAGGDIIFSPGLSGELWKQTPNGERSRLEIQGTMPQSSSDGKKVLYIRDLATEYHRRESRILDVDTMRTSEVGSGLQAPAFSSDGKSVIALAISLDGTVCEYDLAQEKKSVIAKLPGHIGWFRTTSGGVAAQLDDARNSTFLVIGRKAIFLR